MFEVPGNEARVCSSCEWWLYYSVVVNNPDWEPEGCWKKWHKRQSMDVHEILNVHSLDKFLPAYFSYFFSVVL